MPVFSIIIPTFNSEATLRRCLESIIMQTFSDYEVLIIDGVSKDNSLDIISEINDPRIKILSEPDNGIYDAMNKGIKLAKGEWLYFLGSDDELYDDMVLMNISSLAKQTNRKIIYGNVKICGDAGWAMDGTLYDEEFDLRKLLKKNICHQAVFYKRSIFHNLEYNIKYKLCADYDLNLKFWSKYKYHYCPIIVAKFNGGGTSNSLVDNDFSAEYFGNIIRYFKHQLYKVEFKDLLLAIPMPRLYKITLKVYYLILSIKK